MSVVDLHSRVLSGKEFQTDSAATEKARREIWRSHNTARRHCFGSLIGQQAANVAKGSSVIIACHCGIATLMAWQSNRRLEMIVTPSDLSLSETGSLLPATSMDEMLAAERSWCDVPTMTTSDLSGFSWSPLRRNQDLTAAELVVQSQCDAATWEALLLINCFSDFRRVDPFRRYSRSTSKVVRNRAEL